MSPGKISNMGKGSSQSSETKSPSGASSCSIPEEDSTIIPEYSFATIRSKISYFLSFQDAEIQEDFLIYCTKRRSIHFLLFAVFLITFAITPITIAIVIDDGTYLDTNDDQSLGKLICSIVACLFLIIAVITGWKSIQDILKPDKKVVPLNEHSTRSISTKRISSNMASLSSISMDQQSSKKSTVTKLPSDIHSKAHESKMQSSISIQSFIQNIYLSSLLSYPQIHLISIILHFLILFLRSLLWQSCTFHSKTLSNFVGCGYSLEEVGPHLDTALGLYLSRAALAIMTLPLFYFINLPEIPWTTIVGSTTSIFILAIVGLSLDLESSWSIPMTTMWYLILLAVNTDLHLRNIMNFFTQKALLRLLNENDTVFANEYSNEMRSMIGNVAHDLKTPLASFITGIDYIQIVVDDFLQKLELGEFFDSQQSLHESIVSIAHCLGNIRNTNAFMLMTINRCIDYTKASKGLKLVPRYETIDLRETLELPLQCMQNIQQRIEIKLNAFPLELCSHIITDKQWLQENVLCLLSNAVKYSFLGNVTINVCLEKLPKENTSPKTVDGRHASPVASPQKKTNMKNCASCSGEAINLAMTSSASEDILKVKQAASLFLGEETYLRIEIEDTGIGMTEEAMSTLFNPFKQTQRLAGGTGLGLYSLAKRVEALKGNYGVMRRRDDQQGSLFWFSIPYRPDEMTAAMQKRDYTNPDASIRMELNRSLDSADDKPSSPRMRLPHHIMIPPIDTNVNVATHGHSEISVTNRFLTANAMTPMNRHSNQNGPLNILVVDDSPAILKMSSMMLKRLGHNVTTAENGEVAVKLVCDRWIGIESSFDAIMMDLQMPVMDGLEATRRIRRLEHVPESPSRSRKDSTPLHGDSLRSRNSMLGLEHTLPKQTIIGVSANSDADTMEEAYLAGIDQFLSKPFNVTSFTETINNLLQIKHQNPGTAGVKEPTVSTTQSRVD